MFVYQEFESRVLVPRLYGRVLRISPALVLVALWTGLGMAYAQHDGSVSPPALFAFRHAIHLAPSHPAPYYFLGMAYINSGQVAQARPYWARALALTPPGLSYRSQIADQLQRVDGYLAMAERAQSQAAASAAGTP